MSGINSIHCDGNKNGHQTRLKIGNWSFWSKVETFDREINIGHNQIPKRYVNRLMMRIIMSHNILKGPFGYLAVLKSNS